ncbi:MAG TPA: hypothetical protein VGP76_08075 [Planctomycetaceae bacterium]|jgi:hypothetical protein|nr:hypothetical protein [Planctomycetaceae bacterium]
MQRSFLAIFLAASLSAAALVDSSGTARADRPRRGYGPLVVIAAPPPYYRRYAGPLPGRYGSPYYGIAVNRIFGYPASYIPYGSRVAGGYAYPYGYPEAYGTFGPSAGDWDPYSNPLLQATMLENQLRWGTALPPGYPEPRARARLRQSSPEQKAKSIRAQVQGDVWMKKLRFLNAYERYKVAQSAASDRPEPYFRLGFSLASVANFDSAVKYFKQGLDVDPQWPTHPDKLDTLFGEDNRLSVLTLIERVGGWVREDIRDPDRLFLIGVILHADGDTRASEFFEAAYRLGGSGDHLLAFLNPASGPGGPPPARSGPVWNGPNRGGPTNAYDPGVGNGQIPPPQAQEPQEMMPPQMVSPPSFGPPGEPQGMFSPPGQMPPGQMAPGQMQPGQVPPRGLYQPLPQGARPIAPSNGNANPVNPPQAVPQPTAPQQPGPSRQATPQNSKPAVPALPLPPLPAPEEPSVEGQPGTQSGPSLDGPALAPPSTNGSTTVQSP